MSPVKMGKRHSPMAYLRIIYIDIIINYTVYYRLNFPFAFESTENGSHRWTTRPITTHILEITLTECSVLLPIGSFGWFCWGVSDDGVKTITVPSTVVRKFRKPRTVTVGRSDNDGWIRAWGRGRGAAASLPETFRYTHDRTWYECHYMLSSALSMCYTQFANKHIIVHHWM